MVELQILNQIKSKANKQDEQSNEKLLYRRRNYYCCSYIIVYFRHTATAQHCTGVGLLPTKLLQLIAERSLSMKSQAANFTELLTVKH